MDFQFISADSHVDLPWLPADIFTSQAPSHLQERVPHVVRDAARPYWVDERGTNLGLVNGVSSLGHEYTKGRSARVDRMAETGLWADGERGIARVSDPKLRLQDQDRDGVRAEVIYGPQTLFQMIDSDEVREVMYSAYITWIADFCRQQPERFAGLAPLPVTNPGLAAKEVHRAKELGLAGVDINLSSGQGFGRVYSEPLPGLDSPYWNPIWDAANECQLPVHFHTFVMMSDAKLPKTEDLAGGDAHYRNRVHEAVTRVTLQHSASQVLPRLVFSMVPARYPKLKFVLGESGIGWIPYILERMDSRWDEHFRDIPLEMKPSEYWHRQIYCTFMAERTGLDLLHRLGEDNVMWGNDYPHPDCCWPDSHAVLDELMTGIAETARRKVMCENAAKLYGFSL